MKTSLMMRTVSFLEPDSEKFEPLPAVATYLDPATHQQMVRLGGKQNLLQAAHKYLVQFCKPELPTADEGNIDNATATTSSASENNTTDALHNNMAELPPPVKKFKFLSARLPSITPIPALTNPATCETELVQYVAMLT